VRISLCTVDRFQGHEADLLLLSFVRGGSKKRGAVGFLNSPNRLNVALTRARYQIVIVGDRGYFERCRSPLLNALATSPHYASEYAWRNEP
jgi:superfamily I DNA and/or RNA helicase